MKMKTIITCEHAGNKIPRKYNHLFNSNYSILKKHKAYDIGAVYIYKRLAKIADYSSHTLISRLLIDTNRSSNSKNLFSSFTKNLDDKTRQQIFNKYYFNYRSEIEKFIGDNILKTRLIHLSIHTFTPIFNRKRRDTDIGILFNPKSRLEKEVSSNFKKLLKISFPQYKIRFNSPYLGISDGFTSHLREKFTYEKYAGIELEVNQKFFKSGNNHNIVNKIYQSVFKLFFLYPD